MGFKHQYQGEACNRRLHSCENPWLIPLEIIYKWKIHSYACLMEGMGLGQYLFGALIHPMVYHHVPLCC